eukprot:CAMPEP_0201498962 /NCGR_PEP_ID=MMETSP0151_2-20130828/73851_1 /ASSEMBLY_ACC=CAM_ASM_000257 /TAXON_ID=200890 /ORGANISM="Paramoeba atlantica, Strain 621/1 / CCAP 1560/9" /LENGTH=88 /DNA_ID=CAMNT_0047890927 /DNA_START=60 /DNA_END=326 /DNA_ORIENTATION=-
MDNFELWENTSSSRDHANDFDESIKMGLANVAETVSNWKVCNPDIHFPMDLSIIRKYGKNKLHRNFIKDLQHLGWSISCPDSEERLFL